MSGRGNKRGLFSMLMIFVVILLFGAALFVLVYALSKGSTSVVQDVSLATKENNPMEENYDNGMFRIQDLKYFERGLAEKYNNTINSSVNKSLCERKEEYLLLDLVLNNKKMPVKCEVFVDKQVIKELKTKELYELDDSSKNESLMPVNLGLRKLDKPHKVKVCCDNFCQEKEIKAVC